MALWIGLTFIPCWLHLDLKLKQADKIPVSSFPSPEFPALIWESLYFSNFFHHFRRNLEIIRCVLRLYHLAQKPMTDNSWVVWCYSSLSAHCKPLYYFCSLQNTPCFCDSSNVNVRDILNSFWSHYLLRTEVENQQQIPIWLSHAFFPT